MIGAFWCKFWCILKINDEDKIIAKLKEENDCLKSLLWIHNISFEKPKEIKQLQHQNESNKMSALPIGSVGEKLDHPKLKHYVYNGDQKL